MVIVDLMTGLGLLFLGIAVVDAIHIVLRPHIRLLVEIYQLEKRRASRPILLSEWNLPRA